MQDRTRLHSRRMRRAVVCCGVQRSAALIDASAWYRAAWRCQPCLCLLLLVGGRGGGEQEAVNLLRTEYSLSILDARRLALRVSSGRTVCLRRCGDDGGVLCLGDACVGDPDVREDYDLEAPSPGSQWVEAVGSPSSAPFASRLRQATDYRRLTTDYRLQTTAYRRLGIAFCGRLGNRSWWELAAAVSSAWRSCAALCWRACDGEDEGNGYLGLSHRSAVVESAVEWPWTQSRVLVKSLRLGRRAGRGAGQRGIRDSRFDDHPRIPAGRAAAVGGGLMRAIPAHLRKLVNDSDRWRRGGEAARRPTTGEEALGP